MSSKKLSIPNCQECQNKNSLFCTLSKDERSILQGNKGASFIRKGQVIFHEGNHPHGFYCLYKGTVKISKLGEGGKEQIVRFAKTGELLGYRSALNQEVYHGTATALEDCYVCHLSRDNFFELLQRNSQLSFAVIKMLSEDLKQSEYNLISISQKSVEGRIAQTLLLLQDKFGTDDKGCIRLSLTRKEIGDIAGIATETTIRTLSALSKKGLIDLSGRQIKVLDFAKMEEVAY